MGTLERERNQEGKLLGQAPRAAGRSMSGFGSRRLLHIRQRNGRNAVTLRVALRSPPDPQEPREQGQLGPVNAKQKEENKEREYLSRQWGKRAIKRIKSQISRFSPIPFSNEVMFQVLFFVPRNLNVCFNSSFQASRLSAVAFSLLYTNPGGSKSRDQRAFGGEKK